MTERFINLLSPVESDKMNERVKKLREENQRCYETFDTLIKKIGWKNMTFEVLHYNDMLDEIKPSKHYNDFCNRYFF